MAKVKKVGEVNVALISMLMSIIAIILAAFTLYVASATQAKMDADRKIEHKETVEVWKQIANALDKNAKAVEEMAARGLTPR